MSANRGFRRALFQVHLWLGIALGVGGPRFLWDLHNALGIWLVLFILLWVITGIYFAFPTGFHEVLSEDVIFWISRLHFGRAFGWFVKVAWALLGLVPCVLFVSGALVWWNRVWRERSIRALPESR